MKIGKYSRENGFTLAEVLITLGIIGVVAGMTIPTLMNNIQNAEFKTALKKEISVLNQAAASMRYDNGGTFLGLVDDSNTVKNAFKNYLKVVKDCDENSSAGICWHNSGAWSSYGSVSENTAWGNNSASLLLNDGSMLSFVQTSNTCSSPCGSINRCAMIFVDVNGFKKPNKIGKDIFLLNIQADRITPGGTTGDCDDTNCGNSTSTSVYAGCGCAGWVIEGKDY